MCYVRKRRKSVKKRIIAALLALILLFAIALIYINKKLDAIVSDVAREQIKNDISMRISKTLEKYPFDGNYIDVNYSGGRVTSVGTNAKELNLLKNQVLSDVSAAISQIEEYDVNVSLANILDDEVIFRNLSFCIKANVIPVYSVECSVRSELSGAGINQTHYSVYLSINVNVSAILLISTVRVDSTYEICIADAVIVGDVPTFYVSGE